MTRTATERARDAVRRRKAAGWRRLHTVISPEAARALDRLTDGGVTQRDAIEAALMAMADRYAGKTATHRTDAPAGQA